MKSLVFSVEELYKCSTQSERRNYRLTREFFEAKFRNIIQSFVDGTFNFSFKKKGKVFSNSKINKYEYLFQDLILRKIYKNTRTIYNLSQANRDKIISQIKILLEENNPYWVLKLDLKSFYESINREEIFQKIKSDYRLNRQTLNLVEKIFSLPEFENLNGVPRGLCISSILSELYMKRFDIEVKRISGVYYYARFVDDIILFCNSHSARENAEKEIYSLLEDLKLKLNLGKIQKWNATSEECLVYLGYAFSHERKKLIISIAQNKVNKIKTRIVKSFVNFTKNQDYHLLKQRIKFLSGNIVLKRKTSLSPIFVGIFYNYKMINNFTALKEIDSFYQKIIKSKNGKLGSKLNTLLSETQLKELGKYSFAFGHEKKVRHYFSTDDMKKIVRCWQ